MANIDPKQTPEKTKSHQHTTSFKPVLWTRAKAAMEYEGKGPAAFIRDAVMLRVRQIEIERARENK